MKAKITKFLEEKKQKKKFRLLLRWGRLILVLASSVLLLTKPVFNIIDEKGLENLRTYKITTRSFEVHHIEWSSGLDTLVGAMSVSGFFYGALAILLGCVVCTLFHRYLEIRILACSITAFMAGAYYLIMVYYAILLSQKFFLILYPNLIALLPAVILLTMLSMRNDTVHRLLAIKQEDEEGISEA